MRISIFKRPLALLGAASLLATGAVALTATTANAALPTGGYLTPTPSTGGPGNALTFSMSGPCTNPNATNIQVRLFGGGFPAGGQLVVGNSGTTGYSQNGNGGYIIPMGQTLQDYANLQTPAAQFSGAYSFILTCRTNTSSTSLGDYTTKIFFTSSSAYTVTGPTAAASTTALTVTGDQGTVNPQTLSAQVTPASGGPATGWVEFYDGTTEISGLVPVNGSGAASYAQVLSTGTHQLKAAYTPDDTALFTGSQSTTTAYPPPPAQNTVTTLAVSPGTSAPQYASVTLAGTVNQPAAGSIAFKDASAILATVTVTVGASTSTASYVTSFSSTGSHTFTAVFTPASPALYNPSTSTSSSYSTTAQTAAPVTENITVAIAPGSLVLSVANANDVLLHGASGPTAPAELNANGNLLVASGILNPVTVTDTRAQDQGPTAWTVSGSVLDFSDGASHGISRNNLGWAPSVVDKATSQTVTAGPPITPAQGVAPATANDPILGLGTSRVLATAAAGASTGTAHITAGLTLNAPTNTVPNTVAHPVYSTTLTITAA